MAVTTMMKKRIFRMLSEPATLFCHFHWQMPAVFNWGQNYEKIIKTTKCMVKKM
jgi:hypothetical protein